MILETPRLRLRRWLAADREPFATLNADPEVMTHAGPTLDRATSDALADDADRALGRDRHGLWAVEVREGGRFAGFVGFEGLALQWRLGRWAWGHGYATEAAEAALEVAFLRLDAPRVIAAIAPDDERSLALAARLGMTSGEGPHVLTRLDWLARRTSA